MRPPRSARLARLVALSAVVVAPAGCRHATPVALAPVPPPPAVAAVSPPPRTVSVTYDAPDIWAEFRRPLDPATVDARHVFLKIDTRRVAIHVSWDAAANRVRVIPDSLLALGTTYTVELSSSLEGADGTALGAPYLWQFTTTRVLRPFGPLPTSGTFGESPFVTLSWGGGSAPGAPLRYELYAGDDSTAVATRADPPIYSGTSGIFYPSTRWRENAAIFWSVTGVSDPTGDRFDGPVWRFDTAGPGWSVGSITFGSPSYGWFDALVGRRYCNSITIASGPATTCVLAYGFSNQVPRHLAGVTLDLTVSPAYADSTPGDVWVAGLTGSYSICRLGYPGPPYVDARFPHLASANPPAPGGSVYRFESDALTVFVEAAIRRGGLNGFRVDSERRMEWLTPSYGTGAEWPVLRLSYYVAPPSPAAAVPSIPGPGPAFRLDRARPRAHKSG